ncbi:MAG TPA: hypothetical protein VF290_19915 [Pyrinomonadaceae bacterium]
MPVIINPRLRIAVVAFLTYLLVILTCIPFTGSAQSSPDPRLLQQQQPRPQYREAELLVRFRAGVSRRDRDAIIAKHGVQKKKDLRGESGKSIAAAI